LKAERNKRGGERIGQHRRFSGVEAVQEASRRPKPCGAVAATEGGGGFDFLKKMNEGRVGLAFRARAATGKFEKTEETSWASGPDGLNSTTEQENRFSNWFKDLISESRDLNTFKSNLNWIQKQATIK
jgi:hypothetical protein